jgi:hypothetical protein
MNAHVPGWRDMGEEELAELLMDMMGGEEE